MSDDGEQGTLSGEPPESDDRTVVRCTVCGCSVGKGPAGLGVASHANKHRREFRETFDRRPTDYAEVRELLGVPHPAHDSEQPTLWESLLPATQATLDDGGEP